MTLYRLESAVLSFFNASNTLSEASVLSDAISGKDSPHIFFSLTTGGLSKGLLACRAAMIVESADVLGEVGMGFERLEGGQQVNVGRRC
ncbi:MAG: hypothetical protein WBA76_21220 [Phormidesmis sp.]